MGTVARTKSFRDVVSVNVADRSVSLSHCVESLGLIFDENLTSDSHVSAVYKNCFFHILALSVICLSMSAETAKMVACTIVSSRLDYCNSVLAGMSDSNFNRLERVQYALARVVTGMFASSRDHIKPNYIGCLFGLGYYSRSP